MKMMGFLTILFAFVIGYATFVENDYGTQSAQALVYSSTWFELLLALLGLNLIGNIFRYKLYRKEKLPQFIFHVSFILVLIGAAITRFISYEGVMHLREGQSSNEIISSDVFIVLKQQNRSFEKKLILSPIVDNSFEFRLPVGEKELSIEFVEFIPNAVEQIVADETSPAKLVLVTSDGQGRNQNYLSDGDSKELSGLKVDFNAKLSLGNDIEIKTQEDGSLIFKTHVPVVTFNIGTQEQGQLSGNEYHPFEPMMLYQINGVSLVLKEYLEHGAIQLVDGGKAAQGAASVLKVKASSEGFEKIITLSGRQGIVGQEESFVFDGKRFDLSYGSKIIHLPFSIHLKDFQLDRYKGSNSPSSYASEVVLIDTEQGVHKPFRIYMNHILEHRGFRFYQSSYDMDEMGSILSVNHDYWGTLVTYLGYALMAIGMFWVLASRNSRYTKLSKKISNLKTVALAALMVVGLSSELKAEDDPLKDYVNNIKKVINGIDKEHANRFGELQVQSQNGMIKPINTMAHEVLNKLTRKDSFNGLHANQVFLGMITRPDIWQQVKIIRVSHPDLQEKLGGKGQKLFEFEKFFKHGQYVIGEEVGAAVQKAPKDRNKYDKDLISVDERVNITYMIYTGQLLKIFPFGEPNKWRDPIEAMSSTDTEKAMPVKEIFTQYFAGIDKGIATGDWSLANEKIEALFTYQKEQGSDLVLDDDRVGLEILYYEYNIFENLFPYYLLIGLLLLIIQIIAIISGKEWRLPSNIAMGLLFLGFVAHTAGLALRWYISGHAPWSDGYESMIYIAWATILAGFIYAKSSPIAMSATAILAGIILFVAHLSWMDPQITNLLPVLKSYWLTIHVAIITASYGFLGLGALIGFINLIFMIIASEKNKVSLMVKIKELTYINEKTLIVGLILLTIGNFLGGVWANESWGRYWGWDPKETWALVTILVYSFVVHMRFIPALNTIYTFNLAAVVGFSSVIMTYFGVNFYLSGLHSYAKGDPMPIPEFVYWTIAIVAIAAIWAKVNSLRKELDAQ
jgi:cytochrome c-type biogenesis protein CcsB